MKPALVLLHVFLVVGCAAQPGATSRLERVRALPLPELVGKHGAQGVVFHPAVSEASVPGVVLVHGDYGLTENEATHARRLAEAGYAVVAIDLYRGEAVSDVMDAHIIERGLPLERVLADLKSAANALAALPGVRPEGMGIVGWDIGGGYALDAALHDPRVRAAVMCYGRVITDPALLAPLRAPVLGLLAEKDEGITSATIEQFRKAMQQAGKRLEIHVYPGCRHGFLNPGAADQPLAAEKEANRDAWRRILGFLDAELKGASDM
jgi:carboxymethylenebutenolidase